MATKRLMKCAACGGEDVRRDAWASWNPDTDEWELSSVFDEAWCDECEQSCHIVEDDTGEERVPIKIVPECK